MDGGYADIAGPAASKRLPKTEYRMTSHRIWVVETHQFSLRPEVVKRWCTAVDVVGSAVVDTVESVLVIDMRVVGRLHARPSYSFQSAFCKDDANKLTPVIAQKSFCNIYTAVP